MSAQRQKIPSTFSTQAYKRLYSFNQHPLKQFCEHPDDARASIVAELMQTYPQDSHANIVFDFIKAESARLKRPNDPLRDQLDESFLALVKEAATTASRRPEVGSLPNETQNFTEILEHIIHYHLDEVLSSFSKNVYRLATKVVPNILRGVLRTVSVQQLSKDLFVSENLRSRVQISGCIDRVRHLSTLGTVVLVPTHYSNLDSLLIGWALYEIGLPPFAYGAGLNLFRNPVFGFFMNNLGAYKIDRKKTHPLYKDIIRIFSQTAMERGCHSLFFPGGGRSRSGAMESRLKLGLLGSAVDAANRNVLSDGAKIFIVPCTLSYHSVIEAKSLIESHLQLAPSMQRNFAEQDADEWGSLTSFMRFAWKFFKANSTIKVHFAEAFDVLGNSVDDAGQSYSQTGAPVDYTSYFKGLGTHQKLALTFDEQRNREYTRQLGLRVIESFKRHSILLSSHFVAYSFFEWLRKEKSHSGDDKTLLGLDRVETTMSVSAFLPYFAERLEHLRHLPHAPLLDEVLATSSAEDALHHGIRQLGIYHINQPLVINNNTLYSEDMHLLLYYRNRAFGYGIEGEERWI